MRESERDCKRLRETEKDSMRERVRENKYPIPLCCYVLWVDRKEKERERE